jgi:Protein of unknown function (DUF1571)
MKRSICILGGGTLALVPVGVGGQRPDRDRLSKPVYKVAQQLVDPAVGVQGGDARKAEHPLVPALVMARSAEQTLLKIHDYSATMVKRERIGGKLNDPEYMFVKVRHEPFSVYTYFLGPEKMKGQEAIFVAGRNKGNLLAHGVGLRRAIGMVQLDPTGMIAMAGQRYPITELGVANLTKKLIEVAESDMRYGECDVQFFKDAKINKRSCTCIKVTHPVPRKEFKFNVATVFIDDELNFPVRYAAYEWPETPGSEPQLLEEYTYLDIKINQGFTDADFDDKNPNYRFH